MRTTSRRSALGDRSRHRTGSAGGMKLDGTGDANSQRRPQLTRQQVVTAAIELADSGGVESISMRRLAQQLGVEAMSLYTHVRSKEDLLDAIADALIGMIGVDADAADWRTSLRRMALAARGVMLRHLWAPRVIETRAAPGRPPWPTSTRYSASSAKADSRSRRHTPPCTSSAAGCSDSPGSCSTIPRPPSRRPRPVFPPSSRPPFRTRPRWRSRSPMAAHSGRATTTPSSSSHSTSYSTASAGFADRLARLHDHEVSGGYRSSSATRAWTGSLPSSATTTSPIRSRPSPSFRIERSPAAGDHHRDVEAAFGLAAGGDGRAVGGGDRPGDGQAEPDAVADTGPGLHAAERLEQ